MAWTTLHLRVLTPLFSGDEPKGTPTIRVPSVRGALRFWLRAVIAGRGLVGEADLKNLWQAEQQVLGSTHVPSPIALRIRRQPETSTEKPPEWTNNSRPKAFDGAHYLLGQGLWSYKEGVIRHIPAGAEFDLDVRFSDKDDKDAVNGRFMVALWAWLTYGGLGARTRRGFGQLSCIGVAGAPLPTGWTVGALSRPRTWAGWERLTESVYPPAPPWSDTGPWAELPAGLAGPDTVAEHPALDRSWWEGDMVKLNAVGCGEALHQTGLKWRCFRAGPDALMDDGLPSADTRSPEWKDVIHEVGSSYPVGALGLPVNYYSAKGQRPFSAAVTPIQGIDELLRRASPVWLRPVKLDDGKWQLFTFFFAARLLPEGARLEVKSGRRTLKTLTPPRQAEADRTWARWLNREDRLPPGTDLKAP